MSKLPRRDPCRKLYSLLKITAVVLLAASLPLPAHACDCDEPVIVDGLEAYARSRREGRDPVEGFWGIYLDWQPEEGASRRYRMAVVKNDYGVYPEADYIGVVTCDQPGCTRGEVKLLLSGTGKPDEFDATLLVTDTDGGKGTAVLRRHEETGRDNSVLDLSALEYEGKRMTMGMLRIIGG
ncbi:MAG: hypothetical protein LBB28_04695 [Synergistaceae bacterium]|jgi:hypothetical protein|nr:hypothetical protein [Synergistaceae bacterium]